VGIALSETRQVGQLLDLILTKAREITEADAGFALSRGEGGSFGGSRVARSVVAFLS